MPKKLLLAEDSKILQKVVDITFAHEDYDVHVVDDGKACIAKAREINPDAVLVDAALAGMSGYDVVQALKSDPSTSAIRTVLLVGSFQPFDESKAKEVGADEHITKPFESQALIDKVNVLVTGEKGEAMPSPIPGRAAAPPPAPARPSMPSPGGPATVPGRPEPAGPSIPSSPRQGPATGPRPQVPGMAPRPSQPMPSPAPSATGGPARPGAGAPRPSMPGEAPRTLVPGTPRPPMPGGAPPSRASEEARPSVEVDSELFGQPSGPSQPAGGPPDQRESSTSLAGHQPPGALGQAAPELTEPKRDSVDDWDMSDFGEAEARPEKAVGSSEATELGQSAGTDLESSSKVGGEEIGADDDLDVDVSEDFEEQQPIDQPARDGVDVELDYAAQSLAARVAPPGEPESASAEEPSPSYSMGEALMGSEERTEEPAKAPGDLQPMRAEGTGDWALGDAEAEAIDPSELAPRVAPERTEPTASDAGEHTGGAVFPEVDEPRPIDPEEATALEKPSSTGDDGEPVRRTGLEDEQPEFEDVEFDEAELVDSEPAEPEASLRVDEEVTKIVDASQLVAPEVESPEAPRQEFEEMEPIELEAEEPKAAEALEVESPEAPRREFEEMEPVEFEAAEPESVEASREPSYELGEAEQLDAEVAEPEQEEVTEISGKAACEDDGEAALREALSSASREVIERVAWEVVPELAETIIREELERLIQSRQDKESA